MNTLKDYYNSEKSQMAVLVKMAKADNTVKGSEDMLLRLLAQKLNISIEEFDDIYNNPEKYNFIPPENDEDKFVFFYYLIQLMKVDLSVDIEEIAFCKEIGKKMSLSENKIDDIIKLSILKNKEVVQFETIKELLS